VLDKHKEALGRTSGTESWRGSRQLRDVVAEHLPAAVSVFLAFRNCHPALRIRIVESHAPIMTMLSSRIAFRGRNQFSNATGKVARPFPFEKLRKNVACNVGFSCQDTAWETLFGWMSFCFQAPSCTTNRQLRWSAPETRSNQSMILVGLARAPVQPYGFFPNQRQPLLQFRARIKFAYLLTAF
jgi:hypothetical protein